MKGEEKLEDEEGSGVYAIRVAAPATLPYGGPPGVGPRITPKAVKRISGLRHQHQPGIGSSLNGRRNLIIININWIDHAQEMSFLSTANEP